MHLMGADSIHQFINQQGYTINSSEKNTKGDIFMRNSESVSGTYYDEITPIDINFEHSHDILQPKGGHAKQLDESIGLRLILSQANIPYNEIPNGNEVSDALGVKSRELLDLSHRVGSLHSKE